jgi:hypothetical protein
MLTYQPKKLDNQEEKEKFKSVHGTVGDIAEI